MRCPLPSVPRRLSQTRADTDSHVVGMALSTHLQQSQSNIADVGVLSCSRSITSHPGMAAWSYVNRHLPLPISQPSSFYASIPTNDAFGRLPYFGVRCSTSTTRKEKSFAREMKQLERIQVTVRIMREGIFDVAAHAFSGLMGEKVKMYIVSLNLDPETKEAKVSGEFDLSLVGGREGIEKDDKNDSYLNVPVLLPKDFGTPGAILLDNQHPNEFFLRSITIEMPDAGRIYIPCHSWVTESRYNFGRPRVFFTNQVYLPSETPPALRKYRQDDLLTLRGDGKGERQFGERVYDYDVYNDLGNPDKNKTLTRPVLGSSSKLPYPRRCRTGRKNTENDSASEEPVSGFDDNYVPRDDKFSPLKFECFVGAGVRSFGHDVFQTLLAVLEENKSFNSLDEIFDLYVGDLRSFSTKIRDILRNPRDGTVTDFPPPGVVQANREGWSSNREFARQRLAGINPMVIERLKVFPPRSALNPGIYGPATSSITAEHLERNLEGFTVEEALEKKLLYILDYHDTFMPYLNKINSQDTKAYASRTIFYLSRDGALVPIAIELSLPSQQIGGLASRKVFTPNPNQVADWFWRFAKAQVAVVDSGYHELVSHWLRTHACVEPYIIATHRQLSAMHPLHVLLSPHWKDTLNINAMARAALINASGQVESAFTLGRYSMEVSSVAYKNWRFDEQALPKDLLKRGMAEEDPSAKHGLKLHIEDYPYAADGLELWAAIGQWVKEYLTIYYKNDEAVKQDTELQSWWKEIKDVGHGDHAAAEWWGEMSTVEELEAAAQTMIWVASAHHAAVNFGQYAYAGFMPNSPTVSRRLIPDEGTAEYDEVLKDPAKFFFEMLPTQGQTQLVMAVVEILAQHMSEEQYLGERGDADWTADTRVKAAFAKFRLKLAEVEATIAARNAAHAKLHHRAGPVLLPYTLLKPSSGTGLTFRGVPNSISI